MTNLKLKNYNESNEEIKANAEDFYQLETLVEIILNDLEKRNKRLRKKKSFPFKK